jgi:hypothetical protein
MKQKSRKTSSITWGTLIWSTIVGTVLIGAIAIVGTGSAKALPSHTSPTYKIIDKRALTRTKGMSLADTVPTTIPAHGIALLGGTFILKTLTPAQQLQVVVTQKNATTTAQTFSPIKFWSSALLVSFTDVNTLPIPGEAQQPKNPIQDKPVWLVTFTSPTPLYLPGPVHQPTSTNHFLYHVELAIDAHSGNFLLGFYAP